MIAEAEGWRVLFDGWHWLSEVVSEGAFFAIEIVILDRLLHRKHPIIKPRHGRARHS